MFPASFDIPTHLQWVLRTAWSIANLQMPASVNETVSLNNVRVLDHQFHQQLGSLVDMDSAAVSGLPSALQNRKLLPHLFPALLESVFLSANCRKRVDSWYDRGFDFCGYNFFACRPVSD